ncbi:hypothetical protein HMPREF1556_01262 [Porphyromonas sp. oral taxon 278 str. W7784]|nr:hypothetical protein HMPREF1556_01262 [Porphyromonas sp. oral taxon 278 str. W7784]
MALPLPVEEGYIPLPPLHDKASEALLVPPSKHYWYQARGATGTRRREDGVRGWRRSFFS